MYNLNHYILNHLFCLLSVWKSTAVEKCINSVQANVFIFLPSMKHLGVSLVSAQGPVDQN